MIVWITVHGMLSFEPWPEQQRLSGACSWVLFRSAIVMAGYGITSIESLHLYCGFVFAHMQSCIDIFQTPAAGYRRTPLNLCTLPKAALHARNDMQCRVQFRAHFFLPFCCDALLESGEMCSAIGILSVLFGGVPVVV